MKIKEFHFTPENHFVAMEYHWLILNRTFLILITDTKLIGIKVHGLIGAKSSDPTIDLLPLAIDGDLQNPYSYMDMKYIERLKDVDLLSDSFLRTNNANFIINRRDITKADHDATKKWGMGYYSHDGKVYVTTRDNARREFIILGSQSGQQIARNLRLK
ncbi:MAG: hypothetical protein WDO14_21465 [Bacteroidota bacterium]